MRMEYAEVSERERSTIQQTRQRIMRLGAFFAENPLPEADTAAQWFVYVRAIFKEELGNINNDVSFFATLLAQAYLLQHVDIRPLTRRLRPEERPAWTSMNRRREASALSRRSRRRIPTGEMILAHIRKVPSPTTRLSSRRRTRNTNSSSSPIRLRSL